MRDYCTLVMFARVCGLTICSLGRSWKICKTWSERAVLHVIHQKESQVGEGNYGSKLTEATVRQVKMLAVSGLRQADIMRATGVTRANVWAILHGKSWTHVGFDTSAPAVLADWLRE